MELERTLARRMTRRTVVGVIGSSSLTALIAACVRYEDDDPDEPDDIADPDDDEPDVVDDDDDDDDIDPVDPDDDDDEDDIDPVDPDDDDDDDDDIDPVDPDDDDDDPEVDDDDDDDDDVPEDDDDEDPVDDDEEPDEEVVEADVIVGDVIDYQLEPGERWDGPFGSVTMALHRAWVGGEEASFIRTDASDESFADSHGLVFVPLLANALDVPDSHSELYLFEEAPEGQLPVLSSSPADGGSFSPAFRVNYVRVYDDKGGVTEPLTSESGILGAAEGGYAEIERTDIVVNYPVITWPGGQIPVDDDKVEALGGGQLIEAPDLNAGEVTLKLHQCYPGSRYIITDTSMPEMAPMMGAGPAGGSQLLIEAGAVAPITVFANGLEGTGAMGYQPGVFNTDAGDPAWSPFWEHFTAEWEDEAEAVPVTNQQQLDGLVEAGLLVRYAGTPETDPDSFVVNCSVPILAPVTWRPS